MTEPAPSGDPSPQPAAPASLAERIREWLRNWRGGRQSDDSLREGLEELLEEHTEAETPERSEERALLQNILTASDLRVDDVMVPRADIVAIEEGTALKETVDLIAAAGHSRLPVFRDNLDDVLGMVHIKDLLPFWGGSRKFELARLARKILFVPPSMPVLDLLLQMRASWVHMALVVDEYGGIDGLVTIEDLVEQIVGEIRDEHKKTGGPLLVDRPDGTVEADARCPVETLAERLGIDLLQPGREEDIDTLGGLVFSLLGRIPQRGELISHPSGIAFEVLDADPRRVKRLRLRNLGAARARNAAAPIARTDA